MKKPVFVLVITLIIISTAAGALFMMSCSPSDELISYLNEFLWNLKSGVQNKNIFLNALSDNAMTLGVLVVCGFFKPGFIFSLFVTARKCFISAFAVSAFMFYYNLKGFFAAAALSLPFMIIFTALTVMCCASVSLSCNPDKLPEIKPFIAFSAVSAMTFCAAAIAEGYIVPSLILLILQ